MAQEAHDRIAELRARRRATVQGDELDDELDEDSDDGMEVIVVRE